MVKNWLAKVGDEGSIPGSGRSPGGEKWLPTPVFLPGEPHGQRSLVGCILGGLKESDMTEHTDAHTVFFIYPIIRGD